VRQVVYAKSFERDLHIMAKRGKNLSKLYAVVECLVNDIPLAAKHRAHPLQGKWRPKWDCHIEPDWLLIYEVTAGEILLARTGTHSDLF
jgi:mRNA interferase YafQ